MAPTPPTGRSGPDALSAADHTALVAAKQRLRAAVRQRRAARSAAERVTADAARTRAVIDFIDNASGLTTACYLSVPPEPSTLELIAYLATRGRVLLPVLRREPDWAPYEGPDGLRSGPLGIPEPTGRRLGSAALAEAQLIVCPGLGGTADGLRLGTGGGWYDRALTQAAPTAVRLLLLNDDEVFEALPSQPWDAAMDVLATPGGVRTSAPG